MAYGFFIIFDGKRGLIFLLQHATSATSAVRTAQILSIFKILNYCCVAFFLKHLVEQLFIRNYETHKKLLLKI